MAKKVPTIEDIEQHILDDDMSGWCTYCGEWTHDSCEPDAHHYECPECNHMTCYGAEELIVEMLYK